MTKIITTCKFLHQVDYVKTIEGDGEFDNTSSKNLNEEKGIKVYTSVVKDNHFTVGNKLDIIDRLTRTLKEIRRNYRFNTGTLVQESYVVSRIHYLLEHSTARQTPCLPSCKGIV